MNDHFIDFSDSEFERVCAEEEFDDAVEARKKYGISLERTCPWMVLILKEWEEEPGKFALDKPVPTLSKRYAHGQGKDRFMTMMKCAFKSGSSVPSSTLNRIQK